jgi:hypothetical protein
MPAGFCRAGITVIWPQLYLAEGLPFFGGGLQADILRGGRKPDVLFFIIEMIKKIILAQDGCARAIENIPAKRDLPHIIFVREAG